MIVLVIWLFVMLGFGAWTASIAEGKGRPPVAWGILGVCTGIIGVLIAALMQPTPEAEAARIAAIDAARPRAADSVTSLARLVELHDDGKISDDEFEAAKRQALGL